MLPLPSLGRNPGILAKEQLKNSRIIPGSSEIPPENPKFSHFPPIGVSPFFPPKNRNFPLFHPKIPSGMVFPGGNSVAFWVIPQFCTSVCSWNSRNSRNSRNSVWVWSLVLKSSRSFLRALPAWKKGRRNFLGGFGQEKNGKKRGKFGVFWDLGIPREFLG